MRDIREALDSWYRGARSDLASSLVLTLMVLALARGVVFASLAPFPASTAELQTVTTSWTMAHEFKLSDQGSGTPDKIQEIVSADTSGAAEAESSVAGSTKPSAYHLVAALIMFLTQFLAAGFQVFVLRLINVALSAILVWLSFSLVRRIAPSRRVLQIAVPTVIALHPQVGYAASSATPLMLYIMGFTLLSALTIEHLKTGLPSRKYALATLALLVGAVPMDRWAVVGFGIVGINATFRRKPERQKLWSMLAAALPWVIGSLYIWRSTFVDVITQVLPSVKDSAYLPSLRGEVTVSYATVSMLLKGLVGLPDETAGWAAYPFNTLLLAAGIVVSLFAVAGLLLLAFRWIRPRLAQLPDKRLPDSPRWMKSCAAVFASLIAVTYLSELAPTAQLQGATPGTLGSALKFAVPYLQTMSSIGLLFLLWRYVGDHAGALKELLRPADRANAYAVGGLAALTVYAALTQPPVTPDLPGFPIVAIVPATYFLLLGIQTLWQPLATSRKLVDGALWSLLVINAIAIISRFVPGMYEVLAGTELGDPLLPKWVGALFAIAFAAAAARLIGRLSTVDTPPAARPPEEPPRVAPPQPPPTAQRPHATQGPPVPPAPGGATDSSLNLEWRLPSRG